MRFEIQHQIMASVPVVTAEWRVDGEGDLVLVLNGVEVGYVNHEDGVLYGYRLTERELTQIQPLSINAEKTALACKWPGTVHRIQSEEEDQ